MTSIGEELEKIVPDRVLLNQILRHFIVNPDHLEPSKRVKCKVCNEIQKHCNQLDKMRAHVNI